MGEFDYITVLDSDVGTRMSGGGHVVVVNAGEAPSEAFKRAARKAGETSARRFRLVAHGVVAYGWNGVWGGWGIALGEEDYDFDSVENDWKPLRGAFEGIVPVACASADTGPDAQTPRRPDAQTPRRPDAQTPRRRGRSGPATASSTARGSRRSRTCRSSPPTPTKPTCASSSGCCLGAATSIRFDPNGPPVSIEKAGWVSGHGWAGWKAGAPPT